MTLPLPWAKLGDHQVQENFERIAQQFPVASQNLGNDVLRLGVTGTARKITFGVQSVVWTASTTATPVAVSHGLGTTPVVVQMTMGTGTLSQITLWASALGASQFTINGLSSLSITNTVTVYWVAIG